MSIIVLCPTRGRPSALREAAASLVETRYYGDTQLLAVIDADDPTADEYIGQANPGYRYIIPEHSGGMVAALNAAAKMVGNEATILGFIGDDHRFRTKCWDEAIEKALVKPGFAYGDDGFRRDGDIPTQIFISSEIVAALGYMALPDLYHLYVDNAWRALADGASALHYLPDVLIEHMHPLIGKAEWDEGYKRVNAPAVYLRDEAAFQAWRTSPRFAEDVKRARGALSPATIAIR